MSETNASCKKHLTIEQLEEILASAIVHPHARDFRKMEDFCEAIEDCMKDGHLRLAVVIADDLLAANPEEIEGYWLYRLLSAEPSRAEFNRGHVGTAIGWEVFQLPTCDLSRGSFAIITHHAPTGELHATIFHKTV